MSPLTYELKRVYGKAVEIPLEYYVTVVLCTNKSAVFVFFLCVYYWFLMPTLAVFQPYRGVNNFVLT